MKFNWEEFKASDKIAVHCKTEEEAIDFCNQMHEHGMVWIDGETYLSNTRWKSSENTTHYYPDGYYSSNTYAEENNYTILEWSNYMNEEKENSMNLELNNLTDEQKQQIIGLVKRFEQENKIEDDKLDYHHDWKVYSCSGKVGEACMANMELVQDLFKLGLTAHTEIEAIKIRNRLLVEKELRDWAKKCKDPVDWKGSQRKYYVQYEGKINAVTIDDFVNYAYSDILFTDEKTINKAIESIGQERLIRDYFGIEREEK